MVDWVLGNGLFRAGTIQGGLIGSQGALPSESVVHDPLGVGLAEVDLVFRLLSC